MLRPVLSRIRARSCTASSECPPSSKKLLVMLIGWTPSNSSQIRTSSISMASLGATNASEITRVRAPGPGAPCGPPSRSGVSGSASSITNADGTMYSGSFSFSEAAQLGLLERSPARAATYATSRRSPGESSRASTTTLLHRRVPPQHRLDLPQLDAEAAHLHLLVQPPQVLQRAIRPGAAPGLPSGTAALRHLAECIRDESLGRQLWPSQVAAATPSPPTYSSPGKPTGSGCPSRSRT